MDEFSGYKVIGKAGQWMWIDLFGDPNLPVKYWVRQGEEPIYWKITGDENILDQYNTDLLNQAHILHRPHPYMNNGELRFDRWGFSWHWWRLLKGWKDAMVDILNYEQMLELLYPKLALENVGVNLMVITENGIVSQPFISTVIPDSDDLPIAEYIFKVRSQIRDSLIWYLDVYGYEIDEIQQRLEEADGYDLEDAPNPNKIPWRD